MSIDAFLTSLNTQDFWSFDGSLTTPPCSEGVKWAVLKEVQPISSAQLGIFTALWAGDNAFAEGHGNFRATQPINDRVIYEWREEDWLRDNMSASIVGLSISIGVLGCCFLGLFSCLMCKSSKDDKK